MSLYIQRSFWNPYMQYRSVLICRELIKINHYITFSSLRSDINKINRYKIELVFSPYDIAVYVYGHSQKKRYQYSCNICTKRSPFLALSYCSETIVAHQKKYGILKKTIFSSYSDKNCMFKTKRRHSFCNG